MKKQILGLVAALMLSGAAAHMTFAGDHGHHRLERLSEKLGLDAAQTSSLKGIFEQKMATREDKRQARQEVNALIEAGDTQAAAELAAEQARQHVLQRADFEMQVKAILTQEQFEKWQAMKAKRMQRGHRITH